MTVSSPWQPSHVLAAAAQGAVAVLLAIAAWNGASRTASTSEQLVWAALGTAALLIGITAAAMWFLAGRRAISARYVGMLDPLRANAGGPVVPTVDLVDDAALVAAAGTSRFHRSGCPLANGREVLTGPREDHEAVGRRSCEVCAP